MSVASSPPVSSPVSYRNSPLTLPPGVSSKGVSTAPSSPGLGPTFEEDEEEEEEVLSEEEKLKWAQLEPFLEKVSIYTRVLKEQMDKAKSTYAPPPIQKTIPGSSKAAAKARKQPIPKFDTRTKSKSKAATRGKRNKRARDEMASDSEGSEAEYMRSAKRAKAVSGEAEAEGDADGGSDREEEQAFRQPALITGATLKDYQLEGVAWMAGLYQNGLSGILADEMGLGKTLQTIAFHAYLRERSPAPFMVVCPLSVLNNWEEEFKRFAPEIPICVYHGTREERAELRRTRMVLPKADEDKFLIGSYRHTHTSPTRGKNTHINGDAPGSHDSEDEWKGDGSDENIAPSRNTKAKSSPGRRRGTRGGRTVPDDGDEGAAPVRQTSKITRTGKAKAGGKNLGEGSTPRRTSKRTNSHLGGDQSDEPPLPPHQTTTFPVIITTYEMVMKDRTYFAQYHWGFIVVDEGHRLKNMDCKLMQDIKSLQSSGRMILTGTPLHNNLAELWSLFNFVLPDIFTDLDTFQNWFNLPEMQAAAPTRRSTRLIHSLHAILRPFLLRRLKADVEQDLPPKKEYVLYAPLSKKQRELYDAIVQGRLRNVLLTEQGAKAVRDVEVSADVADEDEEAISTRTRKSAKGKCKNHRSYLHNDREYFRKLEAGEFEEERQRERAQTAAELGQEWQYKAQLKKVNNMNLQNTVMQLRKVCSHPFLFLWPEDPDTRQQILNEELVSASGKMMVLKRLLEELFRRNHKVLLFSQFTTMLDIIEDWVELQGWPFCRIDGSRGPQERRVEVGRFQNGGSAPDAPHLFLLSTRAGGLGLNLVAADTVIFYDQDWNPQMDLQAQDRAHRIGQTKPVLIFRLVSAHTVEAKIMQRATEKRKLEALIIAKGKFKAPTAAATTNGTRKKETMAEMATALLKLEGEKIQVIPDTAAGHASVISDEDLEMLLDRSPEVFAGRGKGWTSSEKKDRAGEREQTAFAVFDAPIDEGGHALAGMMGEAID